MASNFIPMVYAVLKDKGVDTKDMTTEQAIDKYNELVGKSGRYNTESGEPTKTFAGEKEFQEFSSVGEAKKFFQRVALEWERKLYPEEKSVLKFYTSLGAYKINKYLRGQIPESTVLISQVKRIDNAIAKFSLDEPITVFRGTNLVEFGPGIFSLSDIKRKEGQTVELKGFTSSSTNKEYADRHFHGQVLMEIDVPSGEGMGAYLEYITAMNFDGHVAEESEFLIRRNAKMKISKVFRRADDKIIVKAELKNDD